LGGAACGGAGGCSRAAWGMMGWGASVRRARAGHVRRSGPTPAVNAWSLAALRGRRELDGVAGYVGAAAAAPRRHSGVVSLRARLVGAPVRPGRSPCADRTAGPLSVRQPGETGLRAAAWGLPWAPVLLHGACLLQ
jgi:hypothetical protein